MRPKRAHARPKLGRNLRQPNRRLHRLDLAEEGADVLESIVTPMLQQARCFGSDEPLLRVGQIAPRLHMCANFVDDRGRVVFLFLAGEAIIGAQNHRGLVLVLPALLGLRHGGDEIRPAARGNDRVGGLPFPIQLPVTGREMVRRVQDRPLEEALRHGSHPRQRGGEQAHSKRTVDHAPHWRQEASQNSSPRDHPQRHEIGFGPS